MDFVIYLQWIVFRNRMNWMSKSYTLQKETAHGYVKCYGNGPMVLFNVVNVLFGLFRSTVLQTSWLWISSGQQDLYIKIFRQTILSSTKQKVTTKWGPSYQKHTQIHSWFSLNGFDGPWIIDKSPAACTQLHNPLSVHPSVYPSVSPSIHHI